MADKPTLADFLTGDYRDDADAAATAYNPGYPVASNLASATQDEADKELLLPGDQIQDLRVDSLRSLSEYALDLTTGENENAPRSTSGYSPPADRGNPAASSATNANSYLPSTLIGGLAGKQGLADLGEKDLQQIEIARRNFETTSGGRGANSLLKLGSFFTQEQLNQLLSKTGDPGEPSANYLLKNRAHEIGDKVEYMLDATNRFSPDPNSSPYLNPAGGGSEQEAYTKGLYSVQTGRGVLGEYDREAPYVDVTLLRALALKVMLKASGEIPAAHKIGFEEGVLLEGIVNAISKATDLAIPFSDGSNDVQLGLKGTWVGNLRIKNAGGGVPLDGLPEAVKRLIGSQGAEDFLLGNSAKSEVTQDPTSVNSVGNLNSFAEPFNGAMPLGMFNTVLIGLLSLVLVSALIELLVASFYPDEISNSPDPAQPSKLAMGRNSPAGVGDELKDGFLRLLGMPPLKSDANPARAFNLGIQSFFGFELDFKSLATPMGWTKLLTSAISIALSPGYYAVMQRIILRDVSEVGAAFSAAFSAVTPSLLPTTPTTRMMGLFSAFSDLLNSTTFKFVMICAVLGDKAYDAKYDPGRAHAGYDVIPYGKENKMNVLTPANRMALARFTGPSESATVRSALSLHLYNSILLLPTAREDGNFLGGPYAGVKSIGTEEEQLKNGSALNVKEGGSLAATLAPTSNGRFSAELVEQYERLLDLEYTPFYMHDLRTNEIVAMPAFISSVGESFSPEWNETHGYGRTDAVRTYSKTTRTIDLSFKLAAMNPADMNFMWIVINKLVAMCYPQRSTGIKRSKITDDEGTQFIQPFSQIPTASPVIRLRLGELFHSNYSLAGLKRLFGHPEHFQRRENFKPGDLFGENLETYDQYVRGKVKARAQKFVKEDVARKFKAAEGQAYTKNVSYSMQPGTKIVFDTDDKGAGGFGAAMASMLGPPSAEKKYVGAVVKEEVVFEVTDANPISGPAAKDGKKSPNKYYKSKLVFDSAADARAAFGEKFNKIFPDSSAWSNITCYVDIQSMTSKGGFAFVRGDGAIPQMVQDKIKDLLPGWKEEIQDDMAKLHGEGEFFNPDNNAIVRSFKASGGRGLAGVITSMALNYDGAQFGTGVDRSARAPMSVTVTLGFAPIHDLPLGLDSSGELIAPSHPIGTLNPYFGGPGKTDSKLDVAPYQPGGLPPTTPDDSLLGSLKSLSPF